MISRAKNLPAHERRAVTVESVVELARLQNPSEITTAAIAQVLRARWALPGGGGVLIANPVPAEHAMPRDVVDTATAQALAECAAQGISGKAITPFLLQRVNTLTDGDSLASNVQLVLNNARLAAQVAVACAAR